MRSFVAIDLPDMVRNALVEVQSHLQTGRLVPEENLHLTLSFLGDADEAQLEDLHFNVETMKATDVQIGVDGIDLFGDIARPRLVAALVKETKALADLQRFVEQAARKADIDLPRRRFRPHVTIARFSKSVPADTAALQRFLAGFCGFSTPPIAARSMGIYASQLRPEGPEYTALAQYPLG